jgi:hypothetical protein
VPRREEREEEDVQRLLLIFDGHGWLRAATAQRSWEWI